ncbi:MAG: hypothetical protein H0U72_11235 [Nitrosospira sp.]|nr:hypothetical protein [Nitrosospira sp.]
MKRSYGVGDAAAHHLAIPNHFERRDIVLACRAGKCSRIYIAIIFWHSYLQALSYSLLKLLKIEQPRPVRFDSGAP